MQMINAVELIKSHAYKKNTLFVISSTLQRELDVKRILCEKNGYGGVFGRVYYFRFRKKSLVRLFQTVWYMILVHIIALQNRCYDVIIGNYVLFTHRYVIKTMTKMGTVPNVYVVDDGLATINIAVYRTNEKQRRRIYLYFPFYRRGTVLIPFFFSKYYIQQVCFYTIYSINVIGDRVEKNDYGFLKDNYGAILDESQIIKERIIFLGQPLCEHNFMTARILNEHLQKISSAFPNEGCIAYYMHPAERKKIGGQNINVIEYENKVSVEVLAMSFPSKTKVFSFYSSSLITIKRLRNDLDLYCLYDENLVRNNVRLENVYRMLEEEGVCVIKG